jgi:hypothetical protein
MAADVGAEAWCDVVIGEDSDSMENRMVAVAWRPGPATARTSQVPFLLFLACYRSHVAAAMVVTLAIPTVGLWILIDHSDDAREELARGDTATALSTGV